LFLASASHCDDGLIDAQVLAKTSAKLPSRLSLGSHCAARIVPNYSALGKHNDSRVTVSSSSNPSGFRNPRDHQADQTYDK
jgi:hypothetical protein